MGMECGALDRPVGGGVLVASPSREAWDATASDDCALRVLGRTFWPVPLGAFTCRSGAEIETGGPSSVRSGRAACGNHFDGC